jgi:hypothetical protein
VKEHHGQRVTKKYLQFALNAVFEANDWLYARIEKSVPERMEAEDSVKERA